MVSLSVTGTEELSRSFAAMAKPPTRADLNGVLIEAGEPMRVEMARKAPRGDEAPHIAEHIVISPLSSVDGVRIAEGSAAVGIGPSKRFFYGSFLEFGWKFHPFARPFVRPAYETEKAGALAAIGRGLWALVRGRTRSFSGRNL